MNVGATKKHLKGLVLSFKDALKMLYYYKELPTLGLIAQQSPGMKSGNGTWESKNRSNLVFISNHLPRYDQSSADFRLLNVLKIVESIGRFNIHYIYLKTTPDDLKYQKALSSYTKFYRLKAQSDDFCKMIDEINPESIWITSLWQIDYFRFITGLVVALKYRENTRSIIVDTVDFHAKEYQRKYLATNDLESQSLSVNFLKLESELYPKADRLLVVSENEKIDIESEIADVKNCDVLSNIHHIETPFRPFSERKHICFLGNFGTAHNLDAVDFFTTDIFPSIVAQIPSIEFHILGNLSEKLKDRFPQRNIRVLGRINDIKKALSHYRLFVCPLRFGAGLKGKIGNAVETGLPMVTTSIGAEGFPVKNGIHCFITDDPKEFGNRCVQLLSDNRLWNQIANQAAEMLDAECGIKQAAAVINRTLNIN